MKTKHYKKNLFVVLMGCLILTSILPGTSRAALTAPAGLAQLAGNEEISLSWSAAPGATAYVVYRGDTNGGPYSFVAQVQGVGYTDRRISNGSSYYYVVKAISVGDQSPYSAQITASPTAAVLKAPINLKAVPGNGEVSLMWDAVTSAVSYHVYRATSPGGPYTLLTPPAPGPGFTDRGVINGTPYYYVVQTMRDTPGAYSDEVTVTLSELVPTAPTSFSATPGSTWASLSWNVLDGATALNQGVPFVAPSYMATDGTRLYVVTDGGAKIQSLPIAGGPATQLYSASGALQLTVVGDYLYWIDPNSGPSTDTQIWKAPKDGSGTPEAIYTESDIAGWQDDDVIDGSGLCTDGSRLYAADEVQGRVVAMNPDGSGRVRLDSGRYSGGFDTERLNTIAYADGSLYIADAGRNGVAESGIYHLPALGGAFTTLYSGPPLVAPTDIAVGTDFIYIEDSGANTIWKLPRSGGTPSALFTPGAFNQIGGIVLAGNTLFVADQGSGLVYRIDLTTLTTDAAAYATAYAVYRGTAIGGPYTFTGLSHTNTYEDKGLVNGTTYYYVVAGVNANGRGAFSSEAAAAVAVNEKPHAPVLDVKRTASGQVTLCWDNPPGAVSYKVYRSTTAGGPYSDLGVQSPCYYDTADTGIFNGTTYYYVVDAHNASATVARSNEVAVTPVSKLTPPGGIAVIPGNTQATVTWTPVADAPQYWVSASLTPGGAPAFSAYSSGASATLTGLTNGVTYYVKIQSGSDGGGVNFWSSDSAELSVTPSAALPPAPINFYQDVGNTQSSLRWDAAAGATGYDIYRRTGENPWPPAPLATVVGTLFTDSGLANGSKYHYIVAARNANGQGAWAASEIIATPTATATLAPTNVAVVPGNTQATVTWNPVVGANDYWISVATSQGGHNVMSGYSSGGPSFTATGLTNGIPYYFRVQSIGGPASSAFSAEVNITPSVALPPAPINLSLAAVGNTQLSLKWDAAAGATGYDIYRRTGEDPWPVIPLATIGGTLFTDTGLTNGKAYGYAVRAKNTSGPGAWALYQVRGTPVTSTTPAPTKIAVIPGNTEVTVTWDPVVGTTEYYVTVAASPGGNYLTGGFAGGKPSFTATGLTNGQIYYFRVQSTGVPTGSCYSVEVDAAPSTALPAAPINLSLAAVGNTQLSLKWDAVNGAAEYSIYRRTEGMPWPSNPVGVSGSPLFTDSGLVNGTKYHYIVAAVNATGEGAWAQNEVNGTPSAAAKPAPAHVAAVAGNTQVTVSWDPVAGATGYYVAVATSPGGGASTGSGSSTETSYIATGLSNSQTYYFRVQVSSPASSAWSSEVSATTLSPQPGFGTISGRVAVDFAGYSSLGVRNATVALEGTAFAAATDNNGNFTLAAVPFGTYTMVVTAPGMDSVSQPLSLGAQDLTVTIPPMVITQVTGIAGDANGDGRLGLEDVFYILQILSGARAQ